MMARLMKDSGIEWIGEIPEDWAVRKMKTITKMKSGDSINADVIHDNGAYPVYGGNGLRGFTSLITHSGEFILIGRQGALCGNVRLVSGEFWASEHAVVVSPFEGLNIKWFAFFLDAINLNRFSTSAAQPGLAVEQILNLYSIFPAQCDQQKIADYLDQKCSLIDSTIEKEKAVIEKLKAYKQSLITELVTGKLKVENGKLKEREASEMKPSGIEWIGDIPVGWERCRLKNVVNINPNYSESLDESDEISFAPMETIGQGVLTPNKAILSDVKNGYTYFANGDIIMAKVTPCFENGNIAIAENLLNDVGFGSSELYVFRIKGMCRDFLFYFLQNSVFKNGCVSTMYGTGGLKRVSLKFISAYTVFKPDNQEQTSISEYLRKKIEEIDNIINKKLNLVDKFTNYKKSLIYECVTGKREVV